MEKDKEKVKIVAHGSMGITWVIGWLFTIGFMQLSYWKAVTALIIWPYYIGAAVSRFVR